MRYFKPADLSLPWHVEAMASKTTTNMAAIVGLGRVASQVTLLEPEPALYSPAWSCDQSSDQTVTCAYTMGGCSI